VPERGKSRSTAWVELTLESTLCRCLGGLNENYVPPECRGGATQLSIGRPMASGLLWPIFLPTEEHIRIYLLSTETLEAKRLPSGPKCLFEGQPAFSRDGKYLAYWCFRSRDEFSLNSLPLPDGQPKVLSHFQGFINGLTWSADDNKLIYAHGTVASFALGEVTVANGSVKRLAFGQNAALPTVSSKGDKLAFSSSSSNDCHCEVLR
jgi:Tol biopolymer transport system component